LYNKTCPLGLLTVLSYQHYKSIIYNEVVSGDIDLHPELMQNAEILLFSITVANFPRAIKLSKRFHLEGKRIYWGGPEVSMSGPKLLIDNSYIDGIAIGAGESIINDLLNENDRSGRVFLQKNITSYFKLINDFHPLKSILNFDSIKIDYNLLFDLDKYEGLSYLWGNDCLQANKRCYFCGRLSMGLGYRSPEIIWDELLEQYRNGFRFFYNTTDSVTTNLNLFKDFCIKKPNEIKDASHRVFVNANMVNEHLINSLKMINGIAVMGIESFGNLKKSNKINITENDNIQAIERLFKADLKFVVSFVYGLPEDTPESIDYNSEMIRIIVDKYGSNIDSIHISPLLITTGSTAFYDLYNLPLIKEKYRNMSLPLNPIELSNDYFNNFCMISRKDTIYKILELSEEIKAIAPKIKIGAKGILKAELFNQTDLNYFLKDSLANAL
jgi:radical SAM superfamily enzyme YgiQ (UPF0313 family)